MFPRVKASGVGHSWWREQFCAGNGSDALNIAMTELKPTLELMAAPVDPKQWRGRAMPPAFPIQVPGRGGGWWWAGGRAAAGCRMGWWCFTLLTTNLQPLPPTDPCRWQVDELDEKVTVAAGVTQRVRLPPEQQRSGWLEREGAAGAAKGQDSGAQRHTQPPPGWEQGVFRCCSLARPLLAGAAGLPCRVQVRAPARWLDPPCALLVRTTAVGSAGCWSAARAALPPPLLRGQHSPPALPPNPPACPGSWTRPLAAP